MPFFIIIPIWLVLILVAAGLCIAPRRRRVAAYIAVCSTSGLIVSIILSTLLLILAAKLPWPRGGTTVRGIVLIGSYLGGIFLGGLVGIALGAWGLHGVLLRRRSNPQSQCGLSESR